MWDWYTPKSFSEIASILGLVVSILGFGFTIFNVRRSRTAAVNAETAADQARESIRSYQTVSELAEAVRAMEEIKRLQRARQWPLLPDRYEQLRKLLISIKSTNTKLSDRDLETIQGAITHAHSIERQIEKALETGDHKSDVSKLNSTLSRQSDKLFDLLVGMTRG